MMFRAATILLSFLSLGAAFTSPTNIPAFVMRNSSTKLNSTENPVCVVVEAEIQPDRMDEFLDLIKKDAEGSREEEGCQRFDVLRMKDNPNKFIFYEVYDNVDAVTFHKKQSHFDLWTQFKASGGVVSSVSKVCEGLMIN
mmetsp:Transcript_18634/g.17943  ORF Transcript_18634/g.17943 Transcript_18634/m.17943 type:complete len:140 (-) Transcript_18634:277-696(-)|eukprot:CAMPEP_0197831796 /NCGR_PEP_ID=MMETSP1437-20131217/12172_1 /TAXON_ID=49252 ORGANISM="Eucampia antarctica, Strain CCMP1452" /NCGR_SAMPLE_ID=MMETSP1437 /ASSEMBLY_ACC=CAM_ASM_001096 /LENGTH=139 /DNA_ID=CAMNT_0043434867 /DNA_START=37 /DNA_END=456 /DNA_ORIENTATION=+